MCLAGIYYYEMFDFITLKVENMLNNIIKNEDCIFKYLVIVSITRSFKVYKAISDSLENHKIRNCILLSVVQNHLFCIINLWMSCVYMWKHQEIRKNCTKDSLLYKFLEVKASNGMHQVCIEKSPDRHFYPYIRTENSSTSCGCYTVCLVKCVDIAVFCFILNQFSHLWIREKLTIFLLV